MVLEQSGVVADLVDCILAEVHKLSLLHFGIFTLHTIQNSSFDSCASQPRTHGDDGPAGAVYASVAS